MWKEAVVGAALVLGAGQAAQAAVVTATYEGVVLFNPVTGSVDSLGLFGEVDASLVDLEAVLTFTYDTNAPTRQTGIGFDQISAGIGDDFSGIVSAVLSVGGVVQTLVGNRNEQIVVSDGTGSVEPRIEHSAIDVDDAFGPGLSFYESVEADVFPVATGFVNNLETAFTLASFGLGSGQFLFQVTDESAPFFPIQTYGTMRFDSLTVAIAGDPVDPSPVPLPASALTLLAGLGLLGGLRAARRAG